MHPGDQHVYSFYNGDLHLKCFHVHPNWINSPLFKIAERINPKRSFLFVSTVLGKHIPVLPSVMKKTYIDLASQLPELHGNITVMGMAETAVGLGSGVYTEIKKQYPNSVFMCSTRFRIPSQAEFCNFVEEHSHAQDQLIHASTNPDVNNKIRATNTLVLIDDEITTGKTLNNVVDSLLSSGLNKVEHIVIVSLISWSGEHQISFDNYPEIKTTNLSLFNGQFSWEPKDNGPYHNRKMPHSNIVDHPEEPILTSSDWGRIPTDQKIDQIALGQICDAYESGKKILVLGTNEYLWQPYLLALKLEEKGCDVRFSSTTRSPVLEGLYIQHTKAFWDNYGQSIQNFAYNVNPDLYDHILVVVETSEESVDEELLQQLNNKANVINISKASQ